MTTTEAPPIDIQQIRERFAEALRARNLPVYDQPVYEPESHEQPEK